MIIANKFRQKWDFQEGLTSPQTCAKLNVLTPSSLTKKAQLVVLQKNVKKFAR